jgi:GT2 family glycosyltransferase
VDNASWDGSADMVAAKFSEIELVRAPHNLGFAAANNLGWQQARGEYVVLLNPDAFLAADTLTRAVHLMATDPAVALAGGLLVGRNGEHEPSARKFPSLLNDLLTLSGLADRFPHSRLFGRFNRTWADPQRPAYVDWVPGAFAIIRNSVLKRIGFFDERFFLYFEEVDLCRRLKKAGHRVAYWPELKITHFGGESSRTLSGQSFSNHGRQLTLWRMRSMLLYYRKHHGLLLAWLASSAEKTWHWLRAHKNRGQAEKSTESHEIVAHMRRAWSETLGGRVSPPRPW